MPTLRIMVGLPGAGKTRHSKSMKGFIRVCPDEFRADANGGRMAFYDHLEAGIWRKTYAEVDRLLRSGANVVVDATCIDRQSRVRWVAMRASGLATRLEAVVVLTNPIACQERVAHEIRSPGKAASIVKRYQSAWCPPTEAEGFDKIMYRWPTSKPRWKASGGVRLRNW